MNVPVIVQTVALVIVTFGLKDAAVWAYKRIRPPSPSERIDIADQVQEMVLEAAGSLKADLADARKDAADARREAADMRREAVDAHRAHAALARKADDLEVSLNRLRLEVDQLTARMRAWRTAILSPSASLAALRVMVGPDDPPRNGTPQPPPER